MTWIPFKPLDSFKQDFFSLQEAVLEIELAVNPDQAKRDTKLIEEDLRLVRRVLEHLRRKNIVRSLTDHRRGGY